MEFKRKIDGINKKTLQKMSEIEGTLNSSMNQINKKMNENMNGLENRAMTLVQNVRKGVLINYWLDVAKYGLGTAIFVVPVYIGVKLLLGLFGVEMP